MKKYFVLTITLISLVAFVFPQQGEYTRKSVSSLESVWVKDGALQGVSNFDYTTFDRFIDFYIEVERFDYNVLPDGMLSDFRSEANSLSDFSVDALAGVLESTVAEKIVAILNDPDVMQARGSALKSESALQSFAATKAKSLGLTTEELATLMNSAYIYLPFITSMLQEVEGSDVSLVMNGGLIWWQIKTADDGTISVEKVLSAETMGMSSLDKSDQNQRTGEPKYKKFTFGTEQWATSPEQYAQNDAMLAFAKNLGVKTKKIDAFKLSAQIAEADGKKYGFPLGFREGVHLDDGFDLVEYSEDADGNEVANRVGFLRVSKTGDNVGDPSAFTYGKQLMGKKQDVGSVVMEHPNLGIDLRVKVGMVSGMSIPKSLILTGGFSGEELFGDDIESSVGTDITFAYNVAPIVGISQLFLDANIGFSFPVATLNPDLATVPTAAPFLLSAYSGITKKLWFGSSNLGISAGFGMESMNIAGTVLGLDYSYSARALGIKVGADFEKMITPDLSFNLGIQYKIASPPAQVAITIGEAEYEYTAVEWLLMFPNSDLADMNLGGIGFTLGVNYALSELPVNLFGALDPFKKY
jgi:hypothetical protein